MIKVVIADDHALMREGLKHILQTVTDIQICAEATNGFETLQSIRSNPCDVLIMDLSMPGIGGFETIRRLINRDPHAKILVFSIHNELVYVTRALKAGAKGYITKNSGPETIITAVGKIAQGGTFVDPELAQQLAITMTSGLDDSEKIKLLSPREFDVFCLLANGYTTHKAADKLCLSYKTVCNHGTAIKEKLGVATIAELTLLATRQGLIEVHNALQDDG